MPGDKEQSSRVSGARYLALGSAGRRPPGPGRSFGHTRGEPRFFSTVVFDGIRALIPHIGQGSLKDLMTGATPTGGTANLAKVYGNKPSRPPNGQS